MKWVTRERPKTDRIACPWLIKTSSMPTPSSSTSQQLTCWRSAEREGAHSYDAAGARYTHRDGLCTFEVLVDEYQISDPAVQILARIVHGADVSEDRDATPRVAGPAGGRRGIPLPRRTTTTVQLELEWPVYDALYAWCREQGVRGEPPAGLTPTRGDRPRPGPARLRLRRRLRPDRRRPRPRGTPPATRSAAS